VLKRIDGILLRSGIVLSWFKTTSEGPSPSLLPSASAKCLAQEPGHISCVVRFERELMGCHGESPTWILIIHLFGRVTLYRSAIISQRGFRTLCHLDGNTRHWKVKEGQKKLRNGYWGGF
jgi:hypothetical protein